MALTYKESQELKALEQEEASALKAPAQSRAPTNSGLSPQEQQELAALEQEEAQYVNSSDQAPQERKAEAFTQGFGNAASFGYLPQLQAATEPLVQGVMDFFGGDKTDEALRAQGFDIQQPESNYTQRRDQYIREGQQLAEENPYSSGAGSVAGSIASGIATGGGFGKLLGQTGRAATFAGRAKQAAATGAAVGLVRNPGDTEGEVNVTQAGDRLQNAATDALTGAVVQGGLEGLGKVGGAIKGAGGSIAQYAEEKALKAAGAMKKDFKRALGRGKVAELGKTIIDDGLIEVGDDIANIAEKAKVAANESSNRLNSIYKEADDILTIPEIDKSMKLDVKSVAENFKSGLKERHKDNINGDVIVEKVEGYLNKLAKRKDMNFSELRTLRKSIDDEIDHQKLTKELPAVEQELSKLRNSLQEEIGIRLGKIDPKLASAFKAENKKISSLIEIADISKAKNAAEQSNASFGLRERLAGGAGAVVGGTIGASVGGPVGAALGAAAGSTINSINTKVARQYGTPFVAITANKIARALESNPQLLGKFSDPLIKAASASPKEFVASVNLLMKDPEFKKQTNDFQDFNEPSMPRIGDNDRRVVSTKFTRKNQ